jgi:hypothetical protein
VCSDAATAATLYDLAAKAGLALGVAKTASDAIATVASPSASDTARVQATVDAATVAVQQLVTAVAAVPKGG